MLKATLLLVPVLARNQSQSPPYWSCTDVADAPATQQYSQISASFVVPPVPEQTKYRTTVSFYHGFQDGGGSDYHGLYLRLTFSSGRWSLQACGSGYIRSADESGQSCGKLISVSPGDAIKTSIKDAAGTWTLSGKDENTGDETLRYITEYNAGPKKYLNAFFSIGLNTYDRSGGEFPCECLPAGSGLQFDEISLNGRSGVQWLPSSGCSGRCGTKLNINSDGSSMQWSWSAGQAVV